jgi:CTP:molybdopterin cytidylyltransferase MocA
LLWRIVVKLKLGIAEMRPLVSVVVPAYNAERTIERTLISALAQSLRELEVVLVNDGSTDGTRAIVSRMEQQDPRLRVIDQPNQGLASARNAGVRAARGDFIAPLDADDLWHPEKIAMQVEAMRAQPEVGMVYCWYWSIDAEDRLLPGGWVASTLSGDVAARLIIENVIGASAPLFRAELLREVSAYPDVDSGCADLGCHLAMAMRAPVAVVPGFLLGYRATPGSMSLDAGRMLRSFDLVAARVRQSCPGLPPWLFRVGRARLGRCIAQRALAAGRRGMAARLIFEALWLDPLIPLALPAHKVAIQRFGLKGRGDDRHLRGRPFHCLPARLDAFEVTGPSWLQSRRLKRAASYACRTPHQGDAPCNDACAASAPAQS